MSQSKNVFLYGPQGSGKSTVGKLLTLKLGVRHIETDELLESTHGKIRRLIEKKGKDYFREMESRALLEAIDIVSVSGGVVSLGGGTLLRRENIGFINQVQGRIITLMGDWDTLFDRIQSDRVNDRPFAPDRSEFFHLMKERVSHYQQFFPRVPIDGKEPGKIVDDILGLYN